MISLSPQTKAYIIAFAPVGLAVFSALAVEELAGPGYTIAVNQDSIFIRYLWAHVFPWLMVPFTFWARRTAERKWRATILSAVLLIVATWLNYLIMS
ncbi:MAG: hypothetical protein ACXW30_03430 [Micavibrio sp.]